MNGLSLSAIALGAALVVSSVLPAAAMPATSQPAQATSRVQQAQVTIKYKTWRGHRGYRYQRPGYRRHSNGFWYPRTAFTVRIAPNVRVRVGPAHVRWCRDRYRSYRISDNTYIVRAGVRRACRSPF